jgi:hypothetical protein
VQNTVTAAAGQPIKTSLSTASEKDLAAALRSNGVDDPESWAQILVQYKPYPAGAAGMQKIQQVLQQFRVTPDNEAKIVSVVEP